MTRKGLARVVAGETDTQHTTMVQETPNSESESEQDRGPERTYESLTDKQRVVVDAFADFEPDSKTYKEIKQYIADEKDVSIGYIGSIKNDLQFLIDWRRNEKSLTTCPDCGKPFESKVELTGHVNSNRTECNWDGTGTSDSPPGAEVIADRLEEYSPDAQTKRSFHSLTNKQRRTIHSIVDLGRNATFAEVAEDAGISDSYVGYVLNNFPHIVDRRLGNKQVQQQMAADGGEQVFNIELTESQAWQAVRDLPDELSNEIFSQIHGRGSGQ